MHVVLYGQPSQTMRHIVPASVASATYEFVDLTKPQGDAERVLESGSATVPAWSLTLDANAGPEEPDAQIIPVAATAGPTIGDTILVTTTSGAFEAAEVRGIAVGNSLEVTSNLARQYTAGDTVTTATITAPIPVELYGFEDALADARPLAVVWSYDFGAGQQVALEQIRLARSNVAAMQTGAAAKLVRGRWPDMQGRLPPGLTVLALAVYCAGDIRSELLSRCESPDKLMTGDPGLRLLYAKIVSEAAIGGWSPGTRDQSTFAAESAKEYSRRLEALVVGQGGTDTTTVSTELTATVTPDETYRSPLRAL